MELYRQTSTGRRFWSCDSSSDEVFEVLWKVPALGGRRLGLYVRFPADVDTVSTVRASMIGGAYIERYSISSSGGLAGSEIAIEGLSTVSTEVLVRIERLDGTTIVARLLAANPSFVVGESLSRLEVARTYTVFGIEHILGGLDHLLFIACLVLIAGTGPPHPDHRHRLYTCSFHYPDPGPPWN